MTTDHGSRTSGTRLRPSVGGPREPVRRKPVARVGVVTRIAGHQGEGTYLPDIEMLHPDEVRRVGGTVAADPAPSY